MNRCVVCDADFDLPEDHAWWCAGRGGKTQTSLLEEQKTYRREHEGMLKLAVNSRYGKARKR